MIFVELCGLPGSGKSTVVIHTKGMLRVAGFNCVDRNDLVRNSGRQRLVSLHTVMGAVQGYRGWAKAIRYALAAKPVRLRRVREAIRMIGRLQLVMRMGSEQQADIVLLEQWMVQDLWAISAATESPEQRRYVSELWRVVAPASEKHCVIYMEVEPDIAARRVERRTDGRSRFDGKHIDIVRAAFRENVSTFRSLLDEADGRGTSTLILDGAAEALQTSEQLAAWLINRLRQGNQREQLG